MKTVSVTEARNNLSALIDGLKSGSAVLIVDRGRPVARLEPVAAGLCGQNDDRLATLIRTGLVRPRRNALPRGFLDEALPRARSSILRALLAERRGMR